MMDLHILITIIKDMKRERLEVNSETLTSYIQRWYPSWYGCIEYPPGMIAQIYSQLQKSQHIIQPCSDRW
jgi:hypothetical protein